MTHEGLPLSQEDTAYKNALRVLRSHEEELLSRENVVGVGVGLRVRGGKVTQEVALVVMVRQKMPSERLSEDEKLPAKIDGVPVDVQEVGVLRAQS